MRLTGFGIIGLQDYTLYILTYWIDFTRIPLADDSSSAYVPCSIEKKEIDYV